MSVMDWFQMLLKTDTKEKEVVPSDDLHSRYRKMFLDFEKVANELKEELRKTDIETNKEEHGISKSTH